ncbi:MAG: YrzE family protein [bacterium]
METTESSRETPYYRDLGETRVSRVSWAAIFGGTLIMLITVMLLSLLGLGIGIGSINLTEETQPLKGIGTGAFIWWVISNIIAVFAGAFTAAKLTNVSYRFSGMLHGVITWSLYALISFVLMTTSIGGVISSVGGAVSKSLSAVGIGISEIPTLVDQVNTDRINRLIQDALAEDEEMGTITEGQQFNIDLMAVVQEVFMEDGEINKDIEREEVEQSVARNSTLSQEDTERAADVIIQEYKRIELQIQQIAQKAEEMGQELAEDLSRAAIWSFVALLLGVLTAILGGSLGKPDLVSDYDTRTP